jgi:acid phosphatase (class A)
LTAETVNLGLFLPPPPAVGSPVYQTEIDELLTWQKNRTADQVEAAKADQAIDVFRFADVVGPAFQAKSLPLTNTLFRRVISDALAALDPVKARYHRPRPYISDPRVQPAVGKPDNDSFPSSHSAGGYLFAILLADMVPEKATDLYARGDLFALHRIIGGAHFPSDVDAGRLSAVLLAQKFFENPRFQADFAGAKVEVRNALGLGSS